MTTNVAQPVFLIDCDNTLFDNDRLKHDLDDHLATALGTTIRDRYWKIYELLRSELGYADFFGAIQELRLEQAYNIEILGLSTFLVEYPFHERLLPKALEVLEHLGAVGELVIVTDGDGVYQPIKLRRTGLWDAVNGRIELFIHKVDRLDDIRGRHPASHHIVVDDKPELLADFKSGWGSSVTTLFVRQGHYADQHRGSGMPNGVDIMVDSLAKLLEINPESLARPVAGATPAEEGP